LQPTKSQQLPNTCFNEEWTCIKGKKYFAHDTGQVSFTTPPKLVTVGDSIDGSYSTIFGPVTGHTGLTYAATNRNQAIGLRNRTFKARASYQTHHSLKWKQQDTLKKMTRFFEHLSHIYTPHTLGFTTVLEWCHHHHDDPHQKKELRISGNIELAHGTYNGLRDGKSFNHATRVWNHIITIKPKKSETGKSGKAIRLIGDLGVEASLQGFGLMEFMKDAMSREPFVYNGGLFIFCKKPSEAVVSKMLDYLIHPPTRFVFIYHSDDSGFSTWINGKLYTFNIDIKSCDVSHSDFLFEAAILITPDHIRSAMRDVCDQLRKPIEIRDINDKKKRSEGPPQRCILKPTNGQRSLASGHVGTTFFNNVACISGGIMMSHEEITCPEDVQRAWLKVGYVVTCEQCTIPEDIQFLKHSPVLSPEGVWSPVLNFGVLLRSSGRCRGDLAGSGSIKDRAEQYTGAHLDGMFPNTTCTLLRNMYMHTQRPSAKMLKSVTSTFRYKYGHGSTPELDFTPRNHSEKRYFDDFYLYRRYRLTPFEISHLNETYGHAGYMGHVASPAIEKILHKDYGLRAKYL
jgi:hypothetical protein